MYGCNCKILSLNVTYQFILSYVKNKTYSKVVNPKAILILVVAVGPK